VVNEVTEAVSGTWSRPVELLVTNADDQVSHPAGSRSQVEFGQQLALLHISLAGASHGETIGCAETRRSVNGMLLRNPPVVQQASCQPQRQLRGAAE
jgi:hypothetical protein